jgi:L-amino acid N-acyltransferase YncA
MKLRDARPEDCEQMLAIYAPFVSDTAVSFELEPPSLAEFSERVSKYQKGWAWLVAEDNGRVLGYAYGSLHRERLAYQWSTEVSVYIAPFAHRRGLGKALYEALFEALAARGFCNAYAIVTLPNAASVGLHESVGFKQVGLFPKIGRKFEQWHDIAWFHKILREEPAPGAVKPA